MNKILSLFMGFFACNYMVAQQLDWAKSMGGTMDEEVRCIAADKNGNTYSTGLFYGTVDFNPGIATNNLTTAGGTDIFICKLDSNGNFVWAKRIGGASYEMANGIAVDTVGNIYVCGYFSGTVDFNPNAGTTSLSSVTGSDDIFVLKLDTAGNFVWVKHMGGTLSEYAYSIALDNQLNVLITGQFKGTVDFDPGGGTKNISALNKDVFVCKLTNAGSYAWAGSISGNSDEEGNSIATTSLNEVIIGGYYKGAVDFNPGSGTNYLTAVGGRDAFICKLSAGGGFVWAKTFAGVGEEEVNSLTVDSKNNICSAGYFYGGTADFDPGSNLYSLFSNNTDAFISKLDTAGNFVWAKHIVGTNNSMAWEVAVGGDDAVYTTGYFENANDFDPSTAGVSYLTSQAFLWDAFVLKLDSAGNYRWVKQLSSASDDAGFSLAVDKNSNVYAAGGFQNTMDFNYGGSPVAISAKGFWDIYVCRLSDDPLSVNDFNPGSFVVFPNPVSDQLNVHTTDQVNCKSIKIGDVNGRVRIEQNYFGSIDVSSLSSGIYFVYLDNRATPIKFVKE